MSISIVIVDRHHVYVWIDMLFDKITCIQEIDQCCGKMCDKEVFFAALAATIVFLSTVLVQKLKKRRGHWICPSLLLSCRKYSVNSVIDFMRDLILDDDNLLSLEYWSSAGFHNFFQISSPTFETILKVIRRLLDKTLHFERPFLHTNV